jgi:hypothetical protein
MSPEQQYELVVSEREIDLLIEGLSADISEYETADGEMNESRALRVRLEKLKGEAS